MAEERMSATFAVFNLHKNKAGIRANREFVEQFGQEAFDTYISPLHERGIMEIFDNPPRTQDREKAVHYRTAWIVLCTVYVNEPDVLSDLRVRLGLRLAEIADEAFGEPSGYIDSDGIDQATRQGIMQARDVVMEELRKAKARRRIRAPRKTEARNG